VRAPALLVLAAILAAAAPARAFCQATTCDNGSTCDPEDVLAACDAKPLRWKRDCVGVALQERASEQASYATAKGILRAAFSAWEKADCGGQGPGIHVEILNKVACDLVEYNDKAGNVNVVVFRDGKWTHPADDHQIALTTVHFEVNTGEIYDADIEVNSADFDLTTGNPVEYDLLSVLTHEAGHFLGLAHSSDPESTMLPQYDAKTVDFRSLSPDDVTGICAIYPPDDFDRETCNPLPRHGYSPSCADSQLEGDCSISAPPSRSTESTLPMGAIVAALVAATARRRRVGGRDQGSEAVDRDQPAGLRAQRRRCRAT
jgi:hypothetical protein